MQSIQAVRHLSLAPAVLGLSIVLTAPLHAGGDHGFDLSMGCDSPCCEGDDLACTMTFGYDDDFGDSTRLNAAYVIVLTASGDVRLPETGNLEIIEVSGNTTAVVGDLLPILVGPPGSTLNGLPGFDESGAVTLAITGYVIQPEDGVLAVNGRAVWEDLCDDPETPPDCPAGFESNASIWALTPVYHPDIELAYTADVTEICAGIPTSVTYAYTVTNPGNVALGVELTDEAPCDFPIFVGGDDNGNFLLDPAETWHYECMAVISRDRTGRAVVFGETELPGCDATDDAELFIPAIECDACPADLDDDGVVGFADLLEIFRAWGSYEDCPPYRPEDLDESCVVDFEDVKAVISSWGACEES